MKLASKSNKVVAVEINKENVLPMEAWKNNIALKKEEEALSNYYSLLGFHELVLEAHAMIMELQNREVSQDLGPRSKTLLKEFQKRAKVESTGIASAIGQLTKTLEINVERLMALN